MQPFSQRIWKERAPSPSIEQIAELTQNLDLLPLTARTLKLRNISTVEQGYDFLHARLSTLPDPDLLPDMAIACGRIEQAIVRGEQISVHGDYDVDGITGCTLLVETLRALGGLVEYHIPLRLKDGYGLSAEAIRQAQAGGCELIISVDCGVSANIEADLAAELGIDLIITDHHQPPEVLPTCLALINPHLPTNKFPWAELSGVGVAFFLLAGLRRRLRENGFFNRHPEPDLRRGLDLVALGSIADIVPLGGVNRVLVRAGLQVLEAGTRPGIKALKKVAAVKQVTCGVVGFRLAPRLNAAGRLEDAGLGVQLLLGDDLRELNSLAERLDNYNQDRQQLEQQTLEQAIALMQEQVDPDAHSIVLAAEQWHSGVIGIVASRLVERFHRPTILIALENGIGKGSARSISNFHLYQALQRCEQSLSGFGGHAMAAGLKINAVKLESFRQQFDEIARTELGTDDLLPSLAYDGDVDFRSLTLSQVQELESLQPFGVGNPQPTFVTRQCQVYSPKILGDKHLKFTAEQDGLRLGCIAFGMAERYSDLNGVLDLLYRPGINSWGGNNTVQLQIVDFIASQENV